MLSDLFSVWVTKPKIPSQATTTTMLERITEVSSQQRDWIDWALIIATLATFVFAAWAVLLMKVALRRSRTEVVAEGFCATTMPNGQIEVQGYARVVCLTGVG